MTLCLLHLMRRNSNCSIFICKKVAYQSMVNKSHINSGTMCLSKIWRRGLSGMRHCISSKVKDKFCIYLFLQLKQNKNAWGPLNFGDNIFLWMCYGVRTHLSSDPKAAYFSGAQNKRRLCSRFRLLCKQFCHLVRRIQQAQWCLEHQ